MKEDTTELTDDQINELYQAHPEIEDPYYQPKKYLGQGITEECAVFRIKIEETEYLVHSNPNRGDNWYKIEN